jgi:filamentous hemagglutinin family protein
VGAGIKLFGGVAVVVMSTVPAHVWANPAGEQVVGGAASFNRPDAATLIVSQQTDRAVINWNSFSIANGELTRFVQPSSTSAALNRVITANPSQIYGTLQANGQIYLINPGGVMVGPGGMVDVAGFVASTHDIANEEFMRGENLNFHGNSEASILNQGRVEAREGDVYLVAREVKNEGQLMARDGTVGMVSGTEVSLQAVGQGNFKIRLLAAENDATAAGSGKREAGGEAEIVNEGVIQAANAVLEAKGSYLPMAIKNTGLIEATGVRENGDGTVSLTGGEGDILNTGVVAALQRSLDGQKETGGSISMTAKNVTSDPGSIITAAGRDGGGSVKLRATDTTILRGAVEVVGISDSAKGGKVQLLGERVGLFDRAKVDASGGVGGGEVLVGGDYLGKNPDVPNAKAVVMAPTAEVHADGTARGNGGRVILWSDEYTGFFGEITTLGGDDGGDGGFVETSSGNNLQAFGRVDASSVGGRSGLWLLDPRNVTIGAVPSSGGDFSGGNPAVFTPTADSATVLNTEINAALDKGTSVTITTGFTGTVELGNITVSAGITKSAGGDAALTLSAANNIQINADIQSTTGKLFMNFIADADTDGTGGFTLGAFDLLSLGGDIAITAAGAVNLSAGTIDTTYRLYPAVAGSTVAGSVLIQPSTSTTIGVGTGVGSFSIADADLDVIDVDGTLLQGTITIGKRVAGNLDVGGVTLTGGTNLSLVTGGTLQGAGTAVEMANGLLTLDAAGDVGALTVDTARLQVITEGTTVDVTSTTTLEQLWVRTAGTTTAQTFADGGNLTYGIDDIAGGDTTILATSVTVGSIDLRYENTAGNITVAAVLQNVEAPGAVAPTLRNLELAAPSGVITINSPGGIFSGGGNITLSARDISVPFAGAVLTLNNAGLPATAYTQQGVINAFQTDGTTFGTRTALTQANNGTAASITGTSGIITLNPTSNQAQGQEVVLSRFGNGASPNTFGLSQAETTMLEANQIRIGGDQTGNILITDLNAPASPEREVTLTSNLGDPENQAETDQSYVPRYFENLFQDATNTGTTTPPGPQDLTPGPHVAGVSVGFVSARGELRNVSGGDLNVGSLSLTAVNDVFFDGRGGSNYAETDTGLSANSIIGSFSARSGRTIEDVTVGNGGSVTVLNAGILVDDARDAAQAAVATGGLTGGAVTSITLASGGSGYSSSPPVTFYGGGIQLGSARAIIDEVSGQVLAVAPQILGQGYVTAPEVTIAAPTSGTQAQAAAFINGGGEIGLFDVTAAGSGYVSPPTVSIAGGGGTGAVARAEVSGGQVTRIVVVDPGSGYTSTPVVKISGGGGTGAEAAFSAFDKNGAATFFSSGATGLSAIRVTTAGSGYVYAPDITLSGGGIALAKANAVVDLVPSSASFGQIVGFDIYDPGEGYLSAPSLAVGYGQAFGNFGEYGISTEQVDRNLASGTIYLSNIGANVVGGILVNAPIRTGDALGVPGGAASSGSMILDAGTGLFANTDGGSDGILITGDASIVPGSTAANARSGNIQILALTIENTASSQLALDAGFNGLPVQIGTATGGARNTRGSLEAQLLLRDSGNSDVGDILIYAPAPGQVEAALGGAPLDPNHPPSSPRSSNDLNISKLGTPGTSTDDSGNTVDSISDINVAAGGFEAELNILPRSESTAEATLVGGQVTLISTESNGVFYRETPQIIISGGGYIPAQGTAIIVNGQLSSVRLDVAGEGYSEAPAVTIDGGNGSGATAVATLVNGRISIEVTNPGFGYSATPAVTISPPANIATGSAILSGDQSGFLERIDVTSPGSGYTSTPQVFIVSGGVSQSYDLPSDRVAFFGDRLEIFTPDTPRNFSILAESAVFAPFTNQRPMNIGAESLGATSLTVTEIERFQGSFLGIGRRLTTAPTVGTGVIEVTLPLNAELVGAENGVILSGTRELLDTGGNAGLAFNEIAIDVGGTVLLTGSGNESHYLAGIIRDSGLASGSANVQATGIVSQSGGVITSGTVVLGGSGYYQNPVVVISDSGIGAGTGAAATATVANGVVTGIVITAGGSGYLNPVMEIREAGPASFTFQSSARTVGATTVPLTIGEIFGNTAYATGQRFYQGITTQNGDITIRADQIQQTRLVGFLDTTGGGAIPVSTATVTLEPLTSGAPIQLYATSQTANTFGLRIGNPQAPGLELVKAASLVIGSASAGAITLNTDLQFNYAQYPQAPYQISLISGSSGSITAGTSQLAGGGTSRVLVGTLTLVDAGAVNLGGSNDVDVLSAILTGAGNAGDLTFHDTDEIRLGQVSVTGDLLITAGGGITQTADGLVVGGTSRFVAGASAIQLDATTNELTGAVSARNTGGGISIGNTLDTILGDIVAGGAAQAVNLVGGGGITQSSGSAIRGGTLLVPAAMGALSVTLPGGSSLSLENSGNQFTSVALAASGVGNLNNVALVNDGSLSLAALTITGNLSLSGAGISQTGIWIVPGTTTLTAGAANNISLGVFANDFGQAVSVVSANDFTLNDTDDLTLGTSSISGATTVTAGGTISQSGAITAINGISSYTVTAGSILLGTQANNFAGQGVTLNGVNGSDVSFRNISANAAYPTIGAASLDDLTIIFNAAPVAVQTRTLTGNLAVTAGGAISQAGGALEVGGSTTLTAGSSNNITLDQNANDFTGPVSIVSGNTVTLDNNNNALVLGASVVSGNLVVENAGTVTDSGVITVAGTSSFGSIGAIPSLILNNGASFGGIVDLDVTGSVTLTSITSDLRLEGLPSATPVNPVTVGGPITLSTIGGNIFIALDAAGDFTSVPTAGVTTSGNFTYRNTVGGFGLNGGAGGFSLTQLVLNRFSVRTLALEATGGDITIGAGGFLVPTIGNLTLTTEAGNVAAAGAITTGTLTFSSAGTASFASDNRIQSFGRALVTTGGLTFENTQGMNLTGPVATLGGGSVDLTVAGQFYNYSGLASPFGGVTGRAVVRSLSMMGGLPSQISALAGFVPSYNFTDPGTSRAMIYAVSPLTMFAPGGTVIAGVDLSGTQTGGGQLNTFFTGSDNLNWMIADFGKFNLPKVDPARLEYMLYQQRVEPETRSLPQPVMRELTQELGRPPTIEEIQQREIANRSAARVRTGAILQRSSFNEDQADAAQEATGPAPVMDGGRPQAGGPSAAPNPLRGGAMEGYEPQAEVPGSDPGSIIGKQAGTDPARGLTPSKKDANGPMLRSGPQKAFALRPEEMDKEQVIQAERERAEVNVAAPVAVSPR